MGKRRSISEEEKKVGDVLGEERRNDKVEERKERERGKDGKELDE